MRPTDKEIKHLAPYLPYRLCCYLKNEQEIVIMQRLCDEVKGLTYLTFAGSKYDRGFAWIKSVQPILFSLSQLNEEITVNNKSFVPFAELYSQAFEIAGDQYAEFIGHAVNEEVDVKECPYWFVERLFEWHFDVFGLIGNGLAIQK